MGVLCCELEHHQIPLCSFNSMWARPHIAAATLTRPQMTFSATMLSGLGSV